VKSRPYRGVDDLRLMQEMLSRHYALTHTRVGDVAWRARYHTHHELSLEIRLWFDDADRLVAWTWLRTRGGLDLEVAPEHRRDERLWSEMLDAVETVVADRLRAGDELEEVYTWFVDDVESMTERLQARGFVPSEGAGGAVLVAGLTPARDPQPVTGDYVLTHVADDADVEARVESHRAAFRPSDLSVSMYRRVRRTWPYRAELDRIVKTSDGVVVACCTAWLDEVNRAGLLEPISTHPAHQNRGLGRLVVADALQALRRAGATVAQVGTSGPAAQAAYMAAGFVPWKREVTLRRIVRAER
jgi:predicted N-acetyltransferase YhbS